MAPRVAPRAARSVGRPPAAAGASASAAELRSPGDYGIERLRVRYQYGAGYAASILLVPFTWRWCRQPDLRLRELLDVVLERLDLAPQSFDLPPPPPRVARYVSEGSPPMAARTAASRPLSTSKGERTDRAQTQRHAASINAFARALRLARSIAAASPPSSSSSTSASACPAHQLYSAFTLPLSAGVWLATFGCEADTYAPWTRRHAAPDARIAPPTSSGLPAGRGRACSRSAASGRLAQMKLMARREGIAMDIGFIGSPMGFHMARRWSRRATASSHSIPGASARPPHRARSTGGPAPPAVLPTRIEPSWRPSDAGHRADVATGRDA